MSQRTHLIIAIVLALVGAVLLLGSPAVEPLAGDLQAAADGPGPLGEHLWRVVASHRDQVRILGGLVLGAGLLVWARAGEPAGASRRSPAGRAACAAGGAPGMD